MVINIYVYGRSKYKLSIHGHNKQLHMSPKDPQCRPLVVCRYPHSPYFALHELFVTVTVAVTNHVIGADGLQLDLVTGSWLLCPYFHFCDWENLQIIVSQITATVPFLLITLFQSFGANRKRLPRTETDRCRALDVNTKGKREKQVENYILHRSQLHRWRTQQSYTTAYLKRSRDSTHLARVNIFGDSEVLEMSKQARNSAWYSVMIIITRNSAWQCDDIYN